jgi:diaminohydroxyphosphoribosylaminopyrimidine deaminase / 5-amino-6-(5-phosphoribosylamino)uracil reductase
MRRCFQLATFGSKEVMPNPKVGAVIVKDDKILGEGFHSKYGAPHAEVEAFDNVPEKDRSKVKGATMYVSLEPCSHFGKTPPCSLRIIQEGISRMVYGCTDPNPLMAGKSLTQLKKAGIKVEGPVLNDAAKRLIVPFRKNLQKRPFIILKLAKSKDNYIGIKDRQIWLTSPATSVLTHKWRSEVHGIMVGKNTVLTDNPALTTRDYPGENPVRIVLDSRLEIPVSAKVLSDNVPTIIFNQLRDGTDGNKSFYKTADLHDNLENVLQQLFEAGIYSLMVEGGAEILKSFIDRNLWDEARVICTPHLLHEGISAPNIEGRLTDKKNMGPDTVFFIANNRTDD